MSLENPYFRSTTCPKKEYLTLIGDIFQRSLKNSQLLHSEDLNQQEKDKAIPYEFIRPSVDYSTVQKWLGLLEPVRYVSKQNQNITKQIMIMNCITMSCRTKKGKGVYPY